MNEIAYAYKQSTTSFDIGDGVLQGAQALLYVLDDGVRADKERRKRLEPGDIRPDEPRRPLHDYIGEVSVVGMPAASTGSCE